MGTASQWGRASNPRPLVMGRRAGAAGGALWTTKGQPGEAEVLQPPA